MRCLSLLEQNPLHTAMRNPHDSLPTGPEPAAFQSIAEQRAGSGKFEINVLFTDPEATALSLQYARTLATGLNADIRLRAAVVVPWRLPLERPHVSVGFTERVLLGLIGHRDRNTSEITAHLYLCRNRVETFLRVLSANSVVMIGERKRPWPSRNEYLARVLQSRGHRVAFVPLRRIR
jgi:hypothetical protein